jgi:hypothetical protein
VKVNLVGLLGGVLGLLSLFLPWWTLNFSSSYSQTASSISESLYLYQSTLSFAAASSLSVGNFWFSWVTFAIILIASLLVLAVSITSEGHSAIADYGRLLLLMGGVLSLFAVIVFPIGVQMQFSGSTGLSSIGLFSSGTYSANGVTLHYSTYLTFGFWATVAATTATLIAFLRYSSDQKKEEEEEEPPPPEPPRPPYRKPVPRNYPPKRYPRF